MNVVMTLADQTLNDLALFAALVAFAAVLVVAALWTAAQLRFDRLLELASRDVGATPKAVVAGIQVAGTFAIVTGFIPSHLLLDPWAATAAALWIMGSVVGLSAMLSTRRRLPVAAEATKAQELPQAQAA
jgi:hypothetical protein